MTQGSGGGGGGPDLLPSHQAQGLTVVPFSVIASSHVHDAAGQASGHRTSCWSQDMCEQGQDAHSPRNQGREQAVSLQQIGTGRPDVSDHGGAWACDTLIGGLKLLEDRAEPEQHIDVLEPMAWGQR